MKIYEPATGEYEHLETKVGDEEDLLVESLMRANSMMSTVSEKRKSRVQLLRTSFD